MKIAHLLLAAALLSSVASCKKELVGSGHVITQQRQTGAFDAIDNEGSMKIVVRKAPHNQIELTGEDNVLEKVVTKVVNGKLSISYASDVDTHNHQDVQVTVMTPVISGIEQNGSGNVQSPDLWVTPGFSATINGSGSIDVLSNNDNFEGTVIGSGTLKISGSGKTSYLKVKGSGKLKAFPFLQTDGTANTEGSGSIEVAASTTLRATIKGSGNVYYKGSPTITADLSGSGKVTKFE